MSVDEVVTHSGRARQITLDAPPGNVLDIAACRELSARIAIAAGDRDACVLVVRGGGDHFSFGASVEEHLPARAPEMLEAMGALILDLARFPYPTLAVVQGRCLGGGLELALACGQIFAADDAVFAAAEIRLGVFAPAATAFLETDVPRAAAEEILLTGRDFPAVEAKRWGLVNRIIERGALDREVDSWIETHFGSRSPASLRVATRALRGTWAERFERRLRRQESLYRDELLPLHDGSEGIRAFLEKRPAAWKNG